MTLIIGTKIFLKDISFSVTVISVISGLNSKPKPVTHDYMIIHDDENLTLQTRETNFNSKLE